jgi:hypothetical protein
VGFVRDLFGKETHQITLEDIKQLMSTRREEDRSLQYKNPTSLRDPEELSQCVSAFLNAEGGVIIIGLCEAKKTKQESLDQKIRPARIAFAPKEYTKEKVEGLILANIGFTSRPSIKVYSVHNPRNVAKAIYLVEIPQGDDPPYQAADGKYYRRVGSVKYAMSHYEIGDLLARRKKPSLALTSELTDVKVEDSSYRFSLRLFVANKGGATARYTQFTASFANAEIESVDRGTVLRSDDIRGGTPSIQWDCADRVLHPTGQRMLIADLTLKLLDNKKPCIFDYTLVAEDTDLIIERYSFGEALLKEAKKKLEKGMAVILTGEEVEEGEGEGE